MILFKSDLAALIILGKKWQTRRYWLNLRAKVGSTHWAQTTLKPDSRFARLRILQAWEWVPFLITKADAIAEGFDSSDAFFKAYNEINKNKPYDPEREHWALEFEVLSLHGSETHPEVIKQALFREARLCEMCGDAFCVQAYAAPDYQESREIIKDSRDFCQPCYAAESVSLDEQLALQV